MRSTSFPPTEESPSMATGTVVDVVMPQMGVSVSEGTITRWMKQVGDHIEADETIVEISTDKVDTEVPSPATGTVREILANEGDTVPVNTRIAVIAAGDGGAQEAPAEPADNAEETPGTPETSQTMAASAAPAPPAPRPAAQPLVAGGADEELYQFNTIRKVIARHMRHSLDTAAHVTTVIEVDMTGVVNLRRKWKPEYQKRYGVNLTYIPFIARATLDAIGSLPWVNAEVRGESALIKRYVNLGMAVAVDDSKGLMVPVIHHAEEMNLVGLSRAVIEMAEKARTKPLAPDEMAGGSFTITNPGVFGALIGTPIIPQGQVAILDVETIVKRPVVVTDEHGNDAIAIRSMMFLCLSYDHRLVDGAYAAQFMAQVKQNLESWDENAFGL